jgi:hypothetical protein
MFESRAKEGWITLVLHDFAYTFGFKGSCPQLYFVTKTQLKNAL